MTWARVALLGCLGVAASSGCILLAGDFDRASNAGKTDAGDVGCATSADCGGGPCDVASGACVGCLPSDLGSCGQGRHCTSALTCADGCLASSDCAADGGTPLLCNAATRTCVGCVSDADCAAGQVCDSIVSRCVAGCTGTRACPSGEDCCGGGCVDVQASAAHCGSCTHACDAVGTESACIAGACGIAACKPGFEDCNHDAGDGCEADLTTSVANCGACGDSCAEVNADTTCSGGSCEFLSCQAGFAHCADAGAGCEVDTMTDPANCGGCGDACMLSFAEAACAAGFCTIARCLGSHVDCDSIASDGCETENGSDPTNCGLCGHVCGLANTTQACANGTCVIGGCFGTWMDCDGLPINGCEANLATDAANCGACGRACDTTHGRAFCVMGSCRISCANGYDDCDGDPDNGCETELASSASNCGVCGAACPADGGVPYCADSVCGVAPCDAGTGDCDGDAATGCATNLASDTSNCGGCGAVCVTPHATPECVDGACAIAACAAGFDDCDGVEANGCEVSLASLTDCGACGVACTPAHAFGSCATRACVITACYDGFGNCDDAGANGCETDFGSDPAHCGACGTTCRDGGTCDGGICSP